MIWIIIYWISFLFMFFYLGYAILKRRIPVVFEMDKHEALSCLYLVALPVINSIAAVIILSLMLANIIIDIRDTCFR